MFLFYNGILQCCDKKCNTWQLGCPSLLCQTKVEVNCGVYESTVLTVMEGEWVHVFVVDKTLENLEREIETIESELQSKPGNS